MPVCWQYWFSVHTTAGRRVRAFPGVWWFRILLLGFALAVLNAEAEAVSLEGPRTLPGPQPTKY